MDRIYLLKMVGLYYVDFDYSKEYHEILTCPRWILFTFELLNFRV